MRDFPSAGRRARRGEAAFEHARRTADYLQRVHGRSVSAAVRVPEGDGKYFHRFDSLDVVAHAVAHGFIELGGSGQSGALAEHFADVFAMLTKQYVLRQTAGEADWLLGAELLTPRVNGVALRSMKAPGTAYDDRVLGRDPQPSHMRGYVRRAMHANSGIPNHAFYLAAELLGGHAWETAGRIWNQALHSLGPRARFRQCAAATWRAAGELYGTNSEPRAAVAEAWATVGLDPRGRQATLPVFDPPMAGAELPLFGLG